MLYAGNMAKYADRKCAKFSMHYLDKLYGIIYNTLLLAMANRKWVLNMTLKDATEGKEYIIQRIETDDEELNAFLFSLGCYSGEPITVVSRRRGSCVVSIKDGRYNIDEQLAEAIIV